MNGKIVLYRPVPKGLSREADELSDAYSKERQTRHLRIESVMCFENNRKCLKREIQYAE